MNVLIVTGLSGAGKTRALQILEDMGYYCMDNISPKILLQLIHGEMQEEGFSKRLAVTMDIRSYGVPDGFDQIVDEMKKCSVSVRVLFLDCAEEVLLKRYKESRRLHPLMSGNRNVNLTDAIRQEIGRMESLKVEADYVVDTSELSTSALREKLTDLFSGPDVAGMRIEFVAFGYKYGILADADLVFDVRCVANPYYVKGLREKTGEDKEVRDFVMGYEEARELFKRMVGYLEYAIPLYEKEGKAQLVVGLGCTGGQHRSVTFASLLRDYFGERYENVRLGMRDMRVNQRRIVGEGD
ncbi:RNase adapter RapZ [Enterocloster lavalensis]|uniref:UPF0042 nucleotide-binding protein n=1 Tax=Enterocloster lavalensis TaxID=460384 RepID=A0A1I0HB73_9FIRM|nr:RNase adapter RapZ [Enterocloster lavalensis]SET80924.1 UPF0042 nucleotide-binding protein [Enterocloster lavalensis]